MKRIILISCTKTKKLYRTKAEEMYSSPWFKKALAYAKKQEADSIFILSDKYYLLRLDDEIDTYEVDLKKMKKFEKEKWKNEVIKQLKEVSDLSNDYYILLAGKIYHSLLKDDLKKLELPLLGKKIGEQLNFFNREIERLSKENEC